jgi:hypothetical protein
MLGINFKTKKALKASVGTGTYFDDHAIDTSLFGSEIKSGARMYTVVGPDPHRNRKYYAKVWVDDAGVITKVT